VIPTQPKPTQLNPVRPAVRSPPRRIRAIICSKCRRRWQRRRRRRRQWRHRSASHREAARPPPLAEPASGRRTLRHPATLSAWGKDSGVIFYRCFSRGDANRTDKGKVALWFLLPRTIFSSPLLPVAAYDSLPSPLVFEAGYYSVTRPRRFCESPILSSPSFPPLEPSSRSTLNSLRMLYNCCLALAST